MDLGYNNQLQLVLGDEHNITVPDHKLPASLGMNIQRVETHGYISRLPLIKIGKYKVSNLLTSYVSKESKDHAIHEGMIGLGLLSRFNLVFDLYGNRLYIEPNQSYDHPFEYNMTGFVFGIPHNGYRTIKTVYPDTPADEICLKAEDKLIMIDGRATGEYNFYELMDLFMHEGREIELQIMRNEKKTNYIIKLRPVI